MENIKKKLEIYLKRFDINMRNNNTHFIDLETGGLQYFQSGVLSCYTHSVLKNDFNNWYFKLKNQKVYDISALKINQIRIDEVNKLSKNTIFDLMFFLEEISLGNDYIILIGQNITGFDIPFIQQMFKDSQKYQALKPIISIDTLEIMKSLNVKELLEINSLSQKVVFDKLYENNYFGDRLNKEIYENLSNNLHSASNDVKVNMFILEYCLDLELNVSEK